MLTRRWVVTRCHARPPVFPSRTVSSPDSVQTADIRWSSHLRNVLHGPDITPTVLFYLVGGRQSVLVLWTWLCLSPADDQSIVVELVFVIVGVELLKVELVA